MARIVRYHEADYTPSEVEAITGVSGDLQRDWRRRGFLEAKSDTKRSRFRASDLGYMMALKAFSDAGVSVAAAKDAASIAVLPIVARLAPRPTSVPPMTSFDPSSPRFVIIAKGEAMRAGSADALRHLFDSTDWADHLGNPVVVVFDCEKASRIILSRVPRPPFVLEVDE